jgi:hypothetical protein
MRSIESKSEIVLKAIVVVTVSVSLAGCGGGTGPLLQPQPLRGLLTLALLH